MTVSRFLRGDTTIKPENRERIAKAVADLGYRPNLVARSMRIRQRGLLAIVVPATVKGYSPARILSAATVAAHEAGFEVETVSVEGGKGPRTRRALELADSRLVEGVLSLASLDEQQLQLSGQTDVPILIEEVYDDELQGIGVLLDAAPIVTMIEHLAELGHRRFFHVGGPVGHPAAQMRKQAYIDTIKRLGLSSAGVAQGDWTGDSGVRAIDDLDDRAGVTAIICTNDELAAGAIKASVARGWRVPEDVSVTGWDNVPVGRYLPPGLTTVQVEHDLLGQRAMRRLISVIRDEAEPPAVDLSELNKVIWRGSVGHAPTTAEPEEPYGMERSMEQDNLASAPIIPPAPRML